MPISPLDFILLQFGSPGYYQAFLGFLLSCLQLPIVFTEHLFRYYTYEPPHRCQLSPSRQSRLTVDPSHRQLKVHKNEWYPLVRRPTVPSWPQPIHNIDHLLLWNHSANVSASKQMFDQCNIYLDPVHHWKGTEPCSNGWEYWLPDNEQNLITEFNLVCDQSHYATMLLYLASVGAIIGSILFGFVADRWGRSKTLNITLYLFVASALSAYFSIDFVQFSIFYIMQTLFINGLQVAAFVLLLEILPTPFHLQASIVWATFAVIASLLVPLLVCAIQNWRYMQLSIAVPSFAFFTYIFVIPSSPLWLTVVKHDMPAAFKTLSQFGKFNGKVLSANQLNQHIQNLYTSTLTLVCHISDTDSAYRQHSPNHPVTGHQQPQSKLHQSPSLSKPGPVLRWYLLTHFYLFFVVTIIGSELVGQHALILHQNVHVNTVYNAFVDLGMLILAYHLAMWLGGRMVQALFFMLNGLLIVVSIVLQEYLRSKAAHSGLQTSNDSNNFDYRFLLLPPVLIVFARSLSRSIVAFVWFYAAKTIPTKIRATGLGCCLFWAQIAKISIPHLFVLSNYLPHNLLLGIFAIMAIIGGALTLLFVPLERKPLPNTLNDLVDDGSSCSTIASSLSAASKRYPSYQDLRNADKNFAVGGTGLDSLANVYTITAVDHDHQQSGALHNTINSQHHRHGHIYSAKLAEIVPAANSNSSNSARLDTEKSSLSSSSQANTLSRTVADRSLIQMSPSASFTVRRGHRPSYIAFKEESVDNDIDLFPTELDNEFTVEDQNNSIPNFHYQGNFDRNDSNNSALFVETLLDNFNRPVNVGNRFKTIQV